MRCVLLRLVVRKLLKSTSVPPDSKTHGGKLRFKIKRLIPDVVNHSHSGRANRVGRRWRPRNARLPARLNMLSNEVTSRQSDRLVYASNQTATRHPGGVLNHHYGAGCLERDLGPTRLASRRSPCRVLGLAPRISGPG